MGPVAIKLFQSLGDAALVNTHLKLTQRHVGSAYLILLLLSSVGRAESIEWVRPVAGAITVSGTAADGLGNVYVSGSAYGTLGETNTGSTDAFIGKYDSGGNILWSRELGTSSSDTSSGVAIDGLGSVYIVGTTQGDLGGPNAGPDDVFVGKYDASGDHIWTRQLGKNGLDQGYGVSADKLGNVYIAGATSGNLAGTTGGDFDAFVSKYDTAGNLLWSRQVSMSESGNAVSYDGLGNVYVWFGHRVAGGPQSICLWRLY